MYIRVNADGSSERKCVTTGEVVSASTIDYGTKSKAFNIFSDYYIDSTWALESFQGDFYWVYLSNSALSDEEIQMVIDANESDFYMDVDKTSLRFEYTGGTATFNISSNTAWVITSSNWLTLSQTSGEGDATITVTASESRDNIASRIGSITITNEYQDVVIIVEIDKAPAIFPQDNLFRKGNEITKLYRNGKVVNKMYREGSEIYQRLYIKPRLDISDIYYEFGLTGGDGTFAITSNSAWTITSDSWITVAPVSGYGNAEISFSVSLNDTGGMRTGYITVSNEVESYSITIVQHMQTINVNLNGEWIESGTTDDGYQIYASNSNYNVDNSLAYMYITFKGYETFTLYGRSYAESNYDYLIISQPNKTPPTEATATSDTVALTTRGKQSTLFTEVVFDGLDPSIEYVITCLYRKDVSSSVNEDRAYVYLPYKQ